MATTSTYIISSVSQLGNDLTVVGTVDGIPVTVVTPLVNTSGTGAGAAMASALAFQAFIQPLMLAALPPQPVQHPELVATFTGPATQVGP